MSKWIERTPLEDLVARAVDDWVSAAEVYEIASRTGVTEPERIRATAIGLVADGIHRGLVVAGWVEHTGHWPWDCSPFDAIGRLASDWFARPNPRPRQGEVFWLDNTSAGNALGLAILERERPGHEDDPSPSAVADRVPSRLASEAPDPTTQRWIDALSVVVRNLDDDSYWHEDDIAEIARAATAEHAERHLCAATLHVLKRAEGSYFPVMEYLAFRFGWSEFRKAVAEELGAALVGEHHRVWPGFLDILEAFEPDWAGVYMHPSLNPGHQPQRVRSNERYSSPFSGRDEDR